MAISTSATSLVSAARSPAPAAVVAASRPADTVVAQLAWGGCNLETAVAVVREPAHMRFLTEQCRLAGMPVDREADVVTQLAGSSSTQRDPPQQSGHATHALDSTTTLQGTGSRAQEPRSSDTSATLLRLRLDEIYVGLYHGFLTLRHTSLSADAFAQALLDAVQRSDDAHASVSPTVDASHQQHVTLAPALRTRLRVFRDLWERGYYVAFGSKFSAELLIYEAAPVHSHAVALVLVRELDAPLDAVAIASHCRVATMVKKRVLFASCDPSTGAVVYIAIDHALLTTRHEL